MKNMLTHPGRNGFKSMPNHPQKRLRTGLFFLVLLILIGSLTACTTGSQSATPTVTFTVVPEDAPTPTQTPTQRPSATPTLPPLGSIGNPITIGFILPPTNLADIAAQELADLLAEETGYVFEVLFYPDFPSLSIAINNGDVHLFWLEPLEYLHLNWRGAAEVMLMTNHLGVFAYGVQFLTNVHSGFWSYFDTEATQSFGDPIEALQQFSGTRPCFLTPQSNPGYFVPLGLLANASTPTLDPVFTYSYNATIRALYIQGICDFGVTYALTGDPLTSGDILSNLPDAQEQIMIVWRSEGIIPNRNLSASPTLPVFIRFRIEEALIRIVGRPEGLNLISTALDYNVEGLRAIEDHFYNPLRSALAPLELDLQSILYTTVE
jgi:phosphonate transport system substrate-binding protein